MTTILRKEKDGLFLYRGENWPIVSEREARGGYAEFSKRLREAWFLSCERSGNRWRVHPDEEQRFVDLMWPQFYAGDIDDLAKDVKAFLSTQETGIQIPNDCYELKPEAHREQSNTWPPKPVKVYLMAYFKSPEQPRETGEYERTMQWAEEQLRETYVKSPERLQENDDEAVIASIAERIRSEYSKHKELDWSRIAAQKIYGSFTVTRK